MAFSYVCPGCQIESGKNPESLQHKLKAPVPGSLLICDYCYQIAQLLEGTTAGQHNVRAVTIEEVRQKDEKMAQTIEEAIRSHATRARVGKA